MTQLNELMKLTFCPVLPKQNYLSYEDDKAHFQAKTTNYKSVMMFMNLAFLLLP